MSNKKTFLGVVGESVDKIKTNYLLEKLIDNAFGDKPYKIMFGNNIILIYDDGCYKFDSEIPNESLFIGALTKSTAVIEHGNLNLFSLNDNDFCFLDCRKTSTEQIFFTSENVGFTIFRSNSNYDEVKSYSPVIIPSIANHIWKFKVSNIINYKIFKFKYF